MSQHAKPTVRSFFASFTDLLTLPQAFWIVVVTYVVESMAYFGILTLMTTYLSGDLRAPEFRAESLVAPATLVQRLTQGTDPVSVTLRARLGTEALGRLQAANAATNTTTLLQELNALLRGPAVWEPQSFAGLALPETASNLLSQTFGLVTPGELMDARALALNLRHGSNAVARLVAARLRPETTQLLAAYNELTRPTNELRRAILRDLNALVLGPSLYLPGAFTDLKLSADVLAAAAQPLTGAKLATFNRSLLEAGFPNLLAERTVPSLKQHGYLNRLLLEAAYPQLLAPGRPPGIGDRWAGIFVSLFTMSVTLFTIGLGTSIEKLGVRRAMLVGLLLCVAGRAVFSYAPAFEGTALVIMLLVALLINAAGPAITTPISYLGVKRYTDAKTNSMGYGLLYALMNLGIVGIGTLSAWIRPGVQAIKDGQPGEHFGQAGLTWLAGVTGSGVQAMNWVSTGITLLILVFFWFAMTKKIEAAEVRPDPVTPPPAGPRPPLWQRCRGFFLEGPFGNARFVFFIFMLLPVRTMFAHQWLTMPTYILRAYDKPVADKMEWLVNWINPGIIFLGVPLFTALTRHINVYKMMLVGTLVSAAPTFLLCLGARLDLLITYFVIFSIGEALWSARFYEYASELAPPGKVAQYMGLANIPWLLAKGTTGFYSGLMLHNYCPAEVPRAEMHTGMMWVIYGCIAMMTPLGLWLARKWALAGLHTSPAAPTPAAAA